MKRTLEDTASQEDNPNIPSPQSPTAATIRFANSRDSPTTNARRFTTTASPDKQLCNSTFNWTMQNIGFIALYTAAIYSGTLATGNLRRIKNVFIIASPYEDTGSESGLAINWAAIFANLQELHFLLPKPSSDYMVYPCDTGLWRSSAAPQLKELIDYLGKLLASKGPEVTIKFDDTGDGGVGELIRRHFPNHSVKVQLSDEVFERSEAPSHYLKKRGYLTFP
ncbi:hypothetical protein HYFRA_00010799 [Hymenoscyphus fraxineus]|uniref:Uncharacterized protein n=1 Tax=Hymenoscyphus fraxineus TaxID=746836 RepID=A0A9N9L397_9HELO|nr:hypothetical protein HYFRA_00010799 [Hymenoscyphus fraxineus]